MNDLGNDDWKFNAKANCIDGLASGVSIGLGQAVKCRIISVNVAARQLNLIPVEPLVGKTRRRKQSKTVKRRCKSR